MNPLLIGAAAVALAYALTRKKNGELSVTGPGGQNGDLRALANAVDADLRANGQAYSKELLSRFQAAAGIAVDGLYGPESANALAAATGKQAPAPIFAGAGQAEPPSNKPLSPSESSEAKRLAELVHADVTSKGRNYDRSLMRQFQRAVHGLYVDGQYGPATAGALQYFTDRKPPDPIYASASGSREVKPYKPPSGTTAISGAGIPGRF
jgi:peptidoglycan hydrolase-like protein with peptidoglycan-binding domain